MSEVLHAVMKVRDIMNEIAAASNEQSRRIEHLSQAIAQMDPVTQQNAALVEEDAAASQSLDDQGRRRPRPCRFSGSRRIDEHEPFSLRSRSERVVR